MMPRWWAALDTWLFFSSPSDFTSPSPIVSTTICSGPNLYTSSLQQHNVRPEPLLTHLFILLHPVSLLSTTSDLQSQEHFQNGYQSIWQWRQAQPRLEREVSRRSFAVPPRRVQARQADHRVSRSEEHT